MTIICKIDDCSSRCFCRINIPEGLKKHFKREVYFSFFVSFKFTKDYDCLVKKSVDAGDEINITCTLKMTLSVY